MFFAGRGDRTREKQQRYKSVKLSGTKTGGVLDLHTYLSLQDVMLPRSTSINVEVVAGSLSKRAE